MNRIHRKYLFSKINVIIVLLVIFIAVLCYLSTINITFNNYERWLNRKETWINFYNTTLFVGKFIGIILSVYIMGSSFVPRIDGYNVLFLRNKKQRIIFFVSKSLTINIIIFLIISLIGLFGVLVMAGFSTWFNNFKDLIKLFINLAFLCLVYGNLSILLSITFKTELIVIVPFVLFIMIEVLIDNSLINYLLIFLPTLALDNSIYTSIHLLILIVIYNFIGCIIYYKKDLV